MKPMTNRELLEQCKALLREYGFNGPAAAVDALNGMRDAGLLIELTGKGDDAPRTIDLFEEVSK